MRDWMCPSLPEMRTRGSWGFILLWDGKGKRTENEKNGTVGSIFQSKREPGSCEQE